MTLPNKITIARLVLVPVFLALLAMKTATLLAIALGIFILAGLTDLLDGYLARKYGQQSDFGRVMDPFVDKLLLCGAFIFLAGKTGSGVRPWMALVIVAREFLVTGIRWWMESSGVPFGAKMLGKLKAFSQFCAVGVSILSLAGAIDWPHVLLAVMWVTIALTVVSGLEYIWKALQITLEKKKS